jgi:hypothetical protein
MLENDILGLEVAGVGGGLVKMGSLSRKCTHYQAVPRYTAQLDPFDISIASCFILAFHLLI